MPDGRQTTIVITGGGPLTRVAALDLHRLIADGARVVAADSGLDHARGVDIAPHELIGDLDSVSAEGVAWARSSGLAIHAFPADKDATDTELALAHAARRPGHLVLAAGTGDRLDHTLGTISALGSACTERAASVRGWIGAAQIFVVRHGRPVTMSGGRGATFSLLALHGPVGDVRVDGARWTLHDDDLPVGSTRGLSNMIDNERVTVSVGAGTLLVVIP